MRCLSPNLRAGSREAERKRSAGSSWEARTQRPAWEPGLPIGTPAHKLLDPCTSSAELPIGASAQILQHSGTPAHQLDPCTSIAELPIGIPAQELHHSGIPAHSNLCASVGPLQKYCRAAFWKPCTDRAMWQKEELLDIWREQKMIVA